MDVAPTTAQVFDRLRASLVEVIGTAATATFLRRAVRKAAGASPELLMLAITKEQLDYQYVVPEHWSSNGAGMPALVNLSTALEGLLLDLTGGVMIRRLGAIPLLRDAGLFRGEKS
ncbi:MAG: hypothetical protein H0T42_34120 [Deltaproteobacteria bacterium]|nr:hypothetical protein [Deltaproteobacteria bacterium]